MMNFSPGGFLEVMIIWPFFAIGLGILYALTFKHDEEKEND